MKKSLTKLGIICLSIPAATQAFSAPRENTMIEEVMVTAEKRSQSIQDIPASISAFDERAVRDAGIVDVSLVAPRVPGFYAGGFGTSRPQLYIRGIGTRQFDPGSESSVGVFVDEAYLGRTGGVLGTLKDVQRIEVLKGPQGTLYGRNVIGGVINVVTKGPSDEFEAEAEVGAGNYNSKNLFGAVSGPLIDGKLSGRAALWHSYREGYMTNLTTGEHPQGLDNSGGRFRLLFTPTDRLRVDLIADFARDVGDSFQGESIGSTANPDGILLGGGGTPKKSGNKFKQFYTTDTKYDRDVDALNAKIEYDFDAGTLISVSTYREMAYSDDRDFDNTSLDVIRQISDEESEQITQEIRFVSSPDGPFSFNGKVDWIAGIYYFSDESTHFDTFKYGPDSAVYAPTADGSYPTDVTGGEFDTTSNAYFGQATILLTDQLDLTLGLRYTKDTKEAVLSGTTTDARPLVSADFMVVNPAQDFTSTDPKAVFNYRVNDELSFYASYSQGFKSGGYQYTSLNASQAGIVFEPEQLEAYELGYKSQWLDNSLTFNGAIYQFNYSDIQVSRVVQLADGSTPSLIDNAGESEIRGFEMDVLYRPTVALTLNFAYAYTDAKYVDYVASNSVDYSDTRMVRAPENSFNIGAEYIIPLKDEMELILRGDYSYNTEFYHEPGEANAKYGTTAPYTKEDAYGLANVRATVNLDSHWRASLWANNVLNEEYRSTILALPGQVINIYGMPRTFGATVAWTY